MKRQPDRNHFCRAQGAEIEEGGLGLHCLVDISPELSLFSFTGNLKNPMLEVSYMTKRFIFYKL